MNGLENTNISGTEAGKKEKKSEKCTESMTQISLNKFFFEYLQPKHKNTGKRFM